MTDKHVPVLLPAVVNQLAIKPDDVVLDGTVGSGGYARAITTSLGADGTFIGIDADWTAVETTKEAIKDFTGRVCLQVTNFRNVAEALKECGIDSLDAAVFDLGFRSEQLTAKRGFSFQERAPLEMTFTHSDDLTEGDITAYNVVNHWKQDTLESLLEGYGNEPYSQEIAAAIVEARKIEEIATTDDLVAIIRRAVPAHYRNGRRHPATRTFQAIRMAVNDEVNALQEALGKTFQVLADGGRLVVVSFHSVEDRTVKRFFSTVADEGRAVIKTDSPITPDKSETDFNPRARSAKLRSITKCPTD